MLTLYSFQYNIFFLSCIKTGLNYQNLGDFPQALIFFSKAIEKNPNNHISFINKAHTLKCLTRFNEAIECYGEAIKLKPSFAYAFTENGKLHMFLNEHKAAVDMFTKALQLDPKNPEKLLDLNKARVRNRYLIIINSFVI